jgi:hypothetical protein
VPAPGGGAVRAAPRGARRGGGRVGDKVYYFPQGHIEQVHYFDAVLLRWAFLPGVQISLVRSSTSN